jgi:hypothetical protein
MTLAMPNLSSIERRMKPFAVPGRWRAITQPAVRTYRPSRQHRNSSADKTHRVSSSAPAVVHRMLIYRQVCTRIVGNQSFFRIHLSKWQCRVFFTKPCALLPKQRSPACRHVRLARESIAPVRNIIYPVQRADASEQREPFHCSATFVSMTDSMEKDF